MEIFIQIIGWLGTVLIVLAYFLISYRKVDGSSKIYQLMNFFGAIGIGANVFYNRAWPAVAMEIIWALIALVALIRIFKN